VIAYLWATSRARRKDQLQELRAAERSDREKADDLGARHFTHHHQGPHRDEEQGEKYGSIGKKPARNGYCESCVDVVLKYAANNLWKRLIFVSEKTIFDGTNPPM